MSTDSDIRTITNPDGDVSHTRVQRFETKSGDERENLAGGMVRSPAGDKVDYTLVRRGPMFQRWAELLARGAKVYGKNNWMLALSSTDAAERAKTKDRYLESAARHFEQWLAGDRSEDHAAAVIFNMNGYEAMLETDSPIKVLQRVCVATDTVKHTPGGDAAPVQRTPKVGDRVRVIRCSPGMGWVGMTGRIVLDRHGIEGCERNPWNVEMDRANARAPHLGHHPTIALGDDEIEVLP